MGNTIKQRYGNTFGISIPPFRPRPSNRPYPPYSPSSSSSSTSSPAPEEDPGTIKQLLNTAKEDFKIISKELQTEPIIHLIRIKVNDELKARSKKPVLAVNDTTNKAVFKNKICDCKLENTLFFQLTFLPGPGQQQEHCFLTSNCSHVLRVDNEYICADPVQGPLDKLDLKKRYYLFHHSGDGEDNDLHSNCLLHPVESMKNSLEYDHEMNALVGSNNVRMSLEKLGSLDTRSDKVTLAGED